MILILIGLYVGPAKSYTNQTNHFDLAGLSPFKVQTSSLNLSLMGGPILKFMSVIRIIHHVGHIIKVIHAKKNNNLSDIYKHKNNSHFIL